MMKKISLSCLLLTTAMWLNNAAAVSSGSYVGFLVGQSDTHNPEQSLQLGTNPETMSDPISPTNSGLAGGFIVGYQVNPYAGFEFGYTHYADSTYQKPANSLVLNDATVRTNSIDIAGKASFPFKAFTVFGKLGIAAITAGSSGSLAPLGSTSVSDTTSARPLYAAGMSYDATQNWVVDFTYTTIPGGSGIQTADLMSFGITYHFVDLMCGQFLC